MKTVYVSGKYTDDTPEKVNQNIRMAALAAVALWRMGYGVLCPHTASAHLEFFDIPYNQILDFDIKLLESGFFDAMYMLPGWENSKGAKLEHEVAKKKGIKIFYTLVEAQTYIILSGLKGPGVP